MSQGPSSAGPSRSVTLSSPRPSTFTYASPDLNVLITGTLLEGQELKDGAQFQLEPNGVYIVSSHLSRLGALMAIIAHLIPTIPIQST